MHKNQIREAALFAHLLRQLPSMHAALFGRVIKHFGSPVTAWQAKRDAWHGSYLPNEMVDRLLSERDDINVERVLKRLEVWHSRYGLELLWHEDSAYPECLRTIPQPPALLYCRGDMNLLKTDLHVSIVGARKANQYGRAVVRDMVPPLVERGTVIVSGLAYGIDQYAHEATVQSSGKTIAVLGSAVLPAEVYPRSNARLAADILESGGLLISEYPPERPSYASHFPERNRIIAGLSQATIVVQASQRSGSLITARFAGECGREVFAVPGDIYSPLSEGTNALIARGGHPWQGVDTFYETLGFHSTSTGNGKDTSHQQKPLIQLNAEEERVCQLFAKEPTTLDEAIEQQSGSRTPHAIIQSVNMLVLKGALRDVGGGRYTPS